ncbi:MAG: deoxynucleoside kinase [Lachnospiraceae bacterium]|nr:deoxynucleoside kinase [Lachnospiraceae bacterium]
MDIFVEGVQGAGKSTLVNALAVKLPGYRVFREGDYNPVELAWCAYMTEPQYAAVLTKYESLREEIIANTHVEGDRRIVTYTRIITDVPGFHKDLERYEIYNGRVGKAEFEDIIFRRFARRSGDDQILECSIFQNIVENQILFYEMTDEEIVDFYRRLKAVLAGRDFRIVYLEAKVIAESLRIIRKERVDANGVEMWFLLMVGFLEESPHGARHGLRGFDGLVKHLEHRMAVEKRILAEVFPEQAVILTSKAYDIDAVLGQM